MALMAVGLSPDSEAVLPALQYLVGVDADSVISFYWRAAPLLNLELYADTVREDLEYMWRYRRRIGAHRDYPAPFFLLKLLRFIEPQLALSFTQEDVMEWVLEEWDPDVCWYDRTSITSMALALIYDLNFPDKDRVIQTTVSFLEDSFTEDGTGLGHFSGHLVDDSFLVYNLCETPYLDSAPASLARKVASTAAWIRSLRQSGGYWEGAPAFGGQVDPRAYPTAVAMRALLAYATSSSAASPHLLAQVASALVDLAPGNNAGNANLVGLRTAFWGDVSTSVAERICFVLMPFSPRKLTEIYERFIKVPVEERTALTCRRADDISGSTDIMRDVWESIVRAEVVIADLTNKNPNVFYELGLCHAIGKKVVLVAQDTGDIPFDLRGVRTIIYEDSVSGYERLSREVLKYILEP
jgi:hypothetical protein